jgi:DNA-binding beta-propeller fold protein YncE
MLAIADKETCSVVVCDARTGATLSSFGSSGSEAGRFLRPAAVCTLPLNGNLLVAEDVSKRIQEVTFSGDHIRFIGSDVIQDVITDVSASESMIAVAVQGPKTQCILLFDSVTGSLQSSVLLASKPVGMGVDGIPAVVHLSRGGSFLYVARGSNSVDVWSVKLGMAPRQLAPVCNPFMFCATDIDTFPNGEIVVVDRLMSSVSFYAPETAAKLLLTSVAWQALHKPRPWRVTSTQSGDAVYVLDRSVGVIVLV